jgi:hypothetical protein
MPVNLLASSEDVQYIEQMRLPVWSTQPVNRKYQASALASGAVGAPRSGLVCQICAMVGLKGGLASAASG